jgi:hypothetical protein
MTLHLDYGDLTPLLSPWHFIKHSAGMLLVLAPPPCAMVAAAPAPAPHATPSSALHLRLLRA